IEDAAAVVYGGTGGLAVASLGSADAARESINDALRPLLGKLHGDYMHRRLKNTRPELQEQDATLRGALVDMCTHSGLVVVGYSGRDRSVMEALREATISGRGFPGGLFWVRRSVARILPAVTQLLADARGNGLQ